MPLTANGVTYAWQELTKRAGLIDPDTLLLNYGDPASAPSDRPVVTVVPCPADAAQTLLSLPPHNLDWVPVTSALPPQAQLPFQDPIPVLFWGKNCATPSHPFVTRLSSRHVVFYADIIAATFFMLTRWEETITPERDMHGRFSAISSAAYRQGFLTRPIVDEYALILRAWLQMLLPNWQPRQQYFRIEISHDVDHIRRFRHLNNVLRTFANNLGHLSPQKAWLTITQAIMEALYPQRAAFYQNIFSLATLSQTYRTNNTFYFMAASPGPLDNEYEIASPHLKACIQQLLEWNFTIGLHPSYHTLNSPTKLRQEKYHLDKILPQPIDKARQHYLRFETPASWNHYCEAGLRHSANMAYYNHEGFRCGTCHPFTPFDHHQDQPIPLTEHPLIIMDKTLQNYRRLTPRQSLECIQSYANRCRKVEGCFSLLWHNGHSDINWSPLSYLYVRTLQNLSSLQTGASS